MKKSQPLALFPNIPLDVQRIKLMRHDVLVLVTDGITEAMNEQDDLFGTERLIQGATRLRALSPQSLCDRLIEEVVAYRGSAPQSDDITALVVRVK